ncbi:MAG: hypothetical protein IPI73_14395 [Betaproteobacteria bacterium]|nr:hypothetical protein [Betaproteobacteria bacterium]
MVGTDFVAARRGDRPRRDPVAARVHAGLREFAQRQGDFAEASVAVRHDWQGGRLVAARIALGAVSPFPARATASERALCAMRVLMRGASGSAAGIAGARQLPAGDNAHKTHPVVTLAERAIARACA